MSEKKQKKRILFVRGYNTCKDDLKTDIYVSIKYYFQHTKYTMEYFTYKMNEDITDVYTRLCNQIKTGKYDSLIGHSMGCNLLSKYISEYNTKKYDKVVLMMPYIFLPQSMRYLFKLPIVKYVYIPKLLGIPNSNLFKEGNILNDSLFPLLSIKQHTQLDFMTEEQFVTFFAKHTHVHLIYAENDQIANIPIELVNQIHNKFIIPDALHEEFHGVDGKSVLFAHLDTLFFPK